MPIVLKGIQCWEVGDPLPKLSRPHMRLTMCSSCHLVQDAVLAAESGVQGVVLSNHGGRQLDFARSGIEVLVEVVAALKDRKMFPNPNFQIFVDGGVRRASDVLKALALGATAGTVQDRAFVPRLNLPLRLLIFSLSRNPSGHW